MKAEIVKFKLRYLQDLRRGCCKGNTARGIAVIIMFAARNLLFTGRYMPSAIRSLNVPAARVLSQLRGGPKTVDELAQSLHITPNAVRMQLRKLQGLNMVTRSGSRPSASKPSSLYSITLEGQIQFSTLYLPVLTQFLVIAEQRCAGSQLETLMRETGVSLASRYKKPAGRPLDRIRAAGRLLTSFGGVITVKRRGGAVMIRSGGCPLAALTADHDEACKLLESFLNEFLDLPVQYCCTRGEEPRCCFEVSA